MFETIKQHRLAWAERTAQQNVRLAVTGAIGEATGFAATAPVHAPKVLADSGTPTALIGSAAKSATSTISTESFVQHWRYGHKPFYEKQTGI